MAVESGNDMRRGDGARGIVRVREADAASQCRVKAAGVTRVARVGAMPGWRSGM